MTDKDNRAVKADDPERALRQNYQNSLYRKFERGLGWLLLSIGAIILLLYGGWMVAQAWFVDPSIPLFIRIAGGALAAGGIVLLVSVLRETLFFHKHERYKDIEQ